ncbi:hypothetical protein [Lentzea sp. E54]|uniref:hypothetical protein n=1 Tax=Lentzea xerophila TaxID=3435883 RepID=UPI003DA3C37F
MSAGLVAWNTTRQPDPDDVPITRDDAESLLRETVSFVQAGDYDGLCQSIATVPSICRHLTTGARTQAPSADAASPAVTSFTADIDQSGSKQVAVLRLRGTHADGSQYTSDFPVVRERREGSVRLSSPTPVYWSGVEYTVSQPCSTTGRQVDACGSNVSTISP